MPFLVLGSSCCYRIRRSAEISHPDRKLDPVCIRSPWLFYWCSLCWNSFETCCFRLPMKVFLTNYKINEKYIRLGTPIDELKKYFFQIIYEFKVTKSHFVNILFSYKYVFLCIPSQVIKLTSVKQQVVLFKQEVLAEISSKNTY